MKVVFLLGTFAFLALAETTAPHIVTAQTAVESGQAALEKKQINVAIELFRKAIHIEPTFLEALEGLADAYLQSGQHLQAGATITQLLEINPEAIRYRLILGQILAEQKQPRRALAQFSAVLQSDPWNPDALLGFAEAARQVGLADRAAEALEKGKARYPSDPRFQSIRRGK